MSGSPQSLATEQIRSHDSGDRNFFRLVMLWFAAHEAGKVYRLLEDRKNLAVHHAQRSLKSGSRQSGSCGTRIDASTEAHEIHQEWNLRNLFRVFRLFRGSKTRKEECR